MSNPILPDGKACNTCNVFLPITSFHKNIKSAGGYLPKCKACRKLAAPPYVGAVVEAARRRAKAYRLKHLDKTNRRAREWALANPDRIKEIAKKHRHSAEGKASARLQVLRRDPARRASASSKYYNQNRDKYRNYVRNRRAMVRGAEGKHTKDDVARIAQAQGMKCVYCTKSLIGVYHADHIIPLALGGTNDKGNIQVLCPTCNRRKGKIHPIDYAQKLGMLL